MKPVHFFILTSIFIVLFTSCYKDQNDKDRKEIEDYIVKNNLNAQELESTGLFYVIKTPGDSIHPLANSDVWVNYEGYLTNGGQFDAANNVHLNLSSVIVGWQKGIPLIGKGGSITLLIPSSMGYGNRQNGIIPAGSVLIFEVDLLRFN